MEFINMVHQHYYGHHRTLEKITKIKLRLLNCADLKYRVSSIEKFSQNTFAILGKGFGFLNFNYACAKICIYKHIKHLVQLKQYYIL